METEDYSLINRQLEVVRKNLATVFRFSVKALIDKACFCSIDDGCEEFINFSASLEHILQHRIRSSKTWYLGDDKGHFWMYIKAACRRHDLRSCITNIDNIENIRSPVARGRAFIRCALMEKRLSEYLVEALRQTNITRRYYLPGAIMLEEDAPELCGILLALNSIDFGFCLKGENYDTVECPLAISYTPFMKFKQSVEGIYSDIEEMRELSCGSSLASEDGMDNEPSVSDPWPDRFNALHKRYMTALQQKSFLEELAASQEKALKAAAAAQRQSVQFQREAAEQKEQYESVIIELQAQVARMKTVNESLQQQLLASRNARFHMEDMAGKGENSVESSQFAAAMAHKQDSDGQSLTSSYERGSSSKAAGGDTRSLASAMSESSMETTETGLKDRRGGEDNQSMMPLTGSLADLHLDLEQGSSNNEVVGSESSRTMSRSSSTIANPEQSTPAVSINSSAYTLTFLEGGDFAGNSDDDNVHFRSDTARHEDPPTPVGDQPSQIPVEGTLPAATQLPPPGAEVDSLPEVLRKGSDNGSDDGKISEPEILAADSGASTDMTSGEIDKDTSDAEVVSQGHEEYAEAQKEVDGEKEAEDQKEAEVGEGEKEHITSEEDLSDPEVLTKEEESSNDGEPSPPGDKDNDGGATSGEAVSAGNKNGKSPVEGETTSDSGSSDGNKAAWDMLSDADHDSN